MTPSYANRPLPTGLAISSVSSLEVQFSKFQCLDLTVETKLDPISLGIDSEMIWQGKNGGRHHRVWSIDIDNAILRLRRSPKVCHSKALNIRGNASNGQSFRIRGGSR